jgi:RNA polymerase sigma-70 factor (ECF subfamily)
VARGVDPTVDPATHRAIEAVARRSYGRLVAYLAARTRDVAAAEDALADALVAALGAWPRDGVPASPDAWLLTSARNRLIDRARHRRVQSLHAEAFAQMTDAWADADTDDVLPDERLKLLFVCAHPAIDPSIHTPLMLQTVLGLDAAAIARAFVVAPATMGQRLVRAKAKIRDAGIAFEVPDARQLPARLDAVLRAIYAAYGSGWEDATGADAHAKGLIDEAIWLARVLKERMPEAAEVRGLLALMLHCEARRPARRSATGAFVPLSEQDPSRWVGALADDAERELAAAAALRQPGRFQLEAAIQSAHAERRMSGSTDWAAIALLYEGLVRIAPTLGARVGRAAAVAEANGAAAGLALLDAIGDAAAYQPYWAVRAHLAAALGRGAVARDAYDRAIELTDDAAIRAFLTAKRDHVG